MKIKVIQHIDVSLCVADAQTQPSCIYNPSPVHAVESRSVKQHRNRTWAYCFYNPKSFFTRFTNNNSTLFLFNSFTSLFLIWEVLIGEAKKPPLDVAPRVLTVSLWAAAHSIMYDRNWERLWETVYCLSRGYLDFLFFRGLSFNEMKNSHWSLSTFFGCSRQPISVIKKRLGPLSDAFIAF